MMGPAMLCSPPLASSQSNADRSSLVIWVRLYDDSVYRVQRHIEGAAPYYELVLIDEFQDFNRMEAAVIDGLAGVSPIVIAGDNDQALYSQLRSASWDHIRANYLGGHYEIF